MAPVTRTTYRRDDTRVRGSGAFDQRVFPPSLLCGILGQVMRELRKRALLSFFALTFLCFRLLVEGEMTGEIDTGE